MQPFYVVGGLLVLAAVYIWSLYNSLVREGIEVDEAWAQIDVQLKRRTDLIPNVIETVKGYAKHEKSVFEQVTKARSALLKAEGPAATAAADNMLTGALKSLFAVAENYPQLKANENFLQLQRELGDTEDKIAYARQFYNTQVMEFNVAVRSFPAVLIANSLGFKAREFFKTEGAERENVKVSFD